MITIAFILSMPGRNTWNGKWSGDESLFAVVRKFKDCTASRILASNGYSYAFGDGWVARVTVMQVDGKQSRDMRKRSQGFCGYEWMIDSIVLDGEIYGPERPKPTDQLCESGKAVVS